MQISLLNPSCLRPAVFFSANYALAWAGAVFEVNRLADFAVVILRMNIRTCVKLCLLGVLFFPVHLVPLVPLTHCSGI